MDLSVIIVSYRGWQKLSNCLEALEKFTQSSFSMEVIIADNHSNDGKIEEFEKRFTSFRFLKSDVNGGFAYGCNRGAEAASADILMFLNPDTIVSEKEIVRLMQNTNQTRGYAIISCRQIREDGREMSAYGSFPGLSFPEIIRKRNINAVSYPDWVSGSLMMMSKETFFRMEGFDESYWMYYEDVDMCRRVRDAGGEIVFFNDITIRHDHGGSSRINLRTTAITKSEVQASRHLYIQKHVTGYKKFFLHSITIIDNLLTGIIAAVAGMILFFIPKLFVRVLVLVQLACYYGGVLTRRSWVSRRSVLYQQLSGK
ncbi:MAG: glycosyltransferase family 2 protein [Bacteroidales bacterium]|nr:glycosyltransferase family 2 protein [Bacteroidales bacterium]MBN2634467.1 glycosyltransferase family 2 protein [Bacteroidales bacterium]